MAPKNPDQPGTGTNQDENASMMFTEREFDKNMSMRPKIYTEFSTDLNGPGNSQKTSINNSSNTMEPKDSDVIKGDSMNLTVTSEVLGPLMLIFQLLHRNLPKNRDFNHSFDV